MDIKSVLDAAGVTALWDNIKAGFVHSFGLETDSDGKKWIRARSGDDDNSVIGEIAVSDIGGGSAGNGKVIQEQSTTTDYRPILLANAHSSDGSGTMGTETERAYKAGAYVKPSTGDIKANTVDAILKLKHNNEINFSGFSSTNKKTWFNYRIGDTDAVNGSAIATEYVFGDGNANYTGSTVYAGTFHGNANSATNVKQTVTTSSNTSARPLLIGNSYSDETPMSFSTSTGAVYAAHKFGIRPNDGLLQVTGTNRTLSIGGNTIYWTPTSAGNSIACALQMKKSDGATVGSTGGYLVNDVLQYWYIGTAYNATFAKFDSKKTTLTGGLCITPQETNYREGIRIKPISSWSVVVLCGNDNTAASGTSANTWTVGNNNGNFHIARNGAGQSTSAILSCVDNIWKINGNAIATETYVTNSITTALNASY